MTIAGGKKYEIDYLVSLRNYNIMLLWIYLFLAHHSTYDSDHSEWCAIARNYNSYDKSLIGYNTIICLVNQ